MLKNEYHFAMHLKVNGNSLFMSYHGNDDSTHVPVHVYSLFSNTPPPPSKEVQSNTDKNCNISPKIAITK